VVRLPHFYPWKGTAVGEPGLIPGRGTKIWKASYNGQKRERERKEAFQKRSRSKDSITTYENTLVTTRTFWKLKRRQAAEVWPCWNNLGNRRLKPSPELHTVEKSSWKKYYQRKKQEDMRTEERVNQRPLLSSSPP